MRIKLSAPNAKRLLEFINKLSGPDLAAYLEELKKEGIDLASLLTDAASEESDSETPAKETIAAVAGRRGPSEEQRRQFARAWGETRDSERDRTQVDRVHVGHNGSAVRMLKDGRIQMSHVGFGDTHQRRQDAIRSHVQATIERLPDGSRRG